MKIETNKIPYYIVNILTVFLLFTFTSLNKATWGRYAFLGIIAVIFVISASSYCGGLRLSLQPFHIFLFIFAVYCGISSFWADYPSNSISDFKTICYILICYSVLYAHYQKGENVSVLFDIIKYSGVAVALYSIFFYGLDNLILATSDENLRLGNSFANINNVGIVIAFTIIMIVKSIIIKRRYAELLLMIPCIVVIAATQSRKAIISVILGIFLMIIMLNKNNKNFYKKLFKFFCAVAVFFLFVYAVSELSVFTGMSGRLQGMMDAFNGNKGADSSSIKRLRMIRYGINTFKQHPFFGIGIKNTFTITRIYLGIDTYLHNNYVELLAGGGIFGFAMYYSIYVYLIYNIIKCKNADKENSAICTVLLIIMLILDYGSVTYYSKQQYFYLMIMFLHIEFMKKRINTT